MANRSSNRTAVPEAKGALDKFKYEVASELGVPLSDGYNGDLTSRQNGSVGGYMVNNMLPERCTDEKGEWGSNGIVISQGNEVFYRKLLSREGHLLPVMYAYALVMQ